MEGLEDKGNSLRVHRGMESPKQWCRQCCCHADTGVATIAVIGWSGILWSLNS